MSLCLCTRTQAAGLQVVLGTYKHQACAPGQTFQAARVVQALDYFAVPVDLWPVGLQLLRRAQLTAELWMERDDQAARTIVQQICNLALEGGPEDQPQPSWDQKYSRAFEGVYTIHRIDGKETVHRYRQQCSHSTGIVKDLLPSLRAAILKAGQPEHLHITFCREPLSILTTEHLILTR